jgi:hypothetical protein
VTAPAAVATATTDNALCLLQFVTHDRYKGADCAHMHDCIQNKTGHHQSSDHQTLQQQGTHGWAVIEYNVLVAAMQKAVSSQSHS